MLKRTKVFKNILKSWKVEKSHIIDVEFCTSATFGIKIAVGCTNCVISRAERKNMKIIKKREQDSSVIFYFEVKNLVQS